VRQIESGIFKPTPSRNEAKGDMTTRVAREIIDGEAAARTAKTARLRAARLAQEATAVADVAPVSRKTKKKS